MKDLVPKEYHIKLIFITGRSENASYQLMLDYEIDMFGDIVQADFMDSYRNNTYKAIYHMK